jgi:Secretion system C-terminal sorting domain
MLQRSADGIHFEDFKEVQPTNNASLKLDYVQLDKQPLAGSSFYRIKMTDTKGRVTYSVVRKVTLNDGTAAGLVYPNPFVNSFSFDITLPSAGDTELRILDFTGKLLHSRVLTGKAGVNTFKVDGVGHLPKGYYIAEFTQHGKRLFREKISRQ